MIEQADLGEAGNYVLGLLDGAELAAFEARLTTDRELSKIVDRLVTQMQALDDTVVAAPVGEDLWARIAGSLGKVSQDEPAASNVTDFSARQRDGVLLGRTPRAVAGWWMATAASVVVAAGLGYIAGDQTDQRAVPVVIAVLFNEGDTTPGAIIEAFADNSVSVTSLEDFVVPAGQILQAWTLPNVATGPVSLGTFASAQSIRLDGPNLPPPLAGQLYEITLEPAPGSPTGRPTGPILVKGFAKPPVI